MDLGLTVGRSVAVVERGYCVIAVRPTEDMNRREIAFCRMVLGRRTFRRPTEIGPMRDGFEERGAERDKRMGDKKLVLVVLNTPTCIAFRCASASVVMTTATGVVGVGCLRRLLT